MGEQRPSGEGTLGKFVDDACWAQDDHLPITENVKYLFSFHGSKLRYVHNPLWVITTVNLTLPLR